MVYRWEKTPSKKSAMSVVKMAMKSGMMSVMVVELPLMLLSRVFRVLP